MDMVLYIHRSLLVADTMRNISWRCVNQSRSSQSSLSLVSSSHLSSLSSPDTAIDTVQVTTVNLLLSQTHLSMFVALTALLPV